jgi:hypothetical protein
MVSNNCGAISKLGELYKRLFVIVEIDVLSILSMSTVTHVATFLISHFTLFN